MHNISICHSELGKTKKRADVHSVVDDVNEQNRLSGRCRLGRFENNPHAVGSCDSLLCCRCVSVAYHCRCTGQEAGLLNVINSFDHLQSSSLASWNNVSQCWVSLRCGNFLHMCTHDVILCAKNANSNYQNCFNLLDSRIFVLKTWMHFAVTALFFFCVVC